MAAERVAEGEDPGALHGLRQRARRAQAQCLLEHLGDPGAAADAARDGLDVAPDDPELLEVLVRALATANEREACREAIDRLLPHLVEGPLRDEMVLLRGA